MSSEETLTPAERDEYDHWLQRIPTGGEGEALWNLMRLQIKHDTAGLRTATEGFPELLDAADRRMRELIDAAREMRAMTDVATAQVAAATEAMQHIRVEFDRRMAESAADRTTLHALVDAADARVGRVERRLSGRIWWLVGAFALLAAEMLYRYVWPLVAAALLSLTLMTWRGGL